MMEKNQIALLKEFVSILKKNPAILHTPELSFFADWLKSLGAKLPTASESKTEYAPPKEESSSDEDIVESELEFDEVDIPDESDILQEMGDSTIEVSEENESESFAKHNEAREKMNEGDYSSAVHLLTAAIKLNGSVPMWYARRAGCFIKLGKPQAALRDCDKAIELNPDNAVALKWRGTAHELLGHWKEAFEDFSRSSSLDYNDDVKEHIDRLKPKYNRIIEHERKYDRLRSEKNNRARIRRVKKAQAERAKEDSGDFCQNGSRDMPMGGMGNLFGDLFNDPELVEAMKDPEVMKAFSESCGDPSKMAQYANNPKLKKVMEKFLSKFGGGAAPGDFGSCRSPFGAGPTSMPTAPDLD